jgi:hypothetical protein
MAQKQRKRAQDYKTLKCKLCTAIQYPHTDDINAKSCYYVGNAHNLGVEGYFRN